MRTATPAPLPHSTDRLRLRGLREGDLQRILDIYTHPRVRALIGDHTLAELREELDFWIAHQAAHGWSLWALEELATGRLVGDCGLQPLELRGPEVELSYDLSPHVWGRGYATEAARATLSLAFGSFGIERVVAVVKSDHAASRAVLERLGCTATGERTAYGERLLGYEIEARRPLEL